MEPLELCAWHESGRVVFAYLNGYTCDGIELSEDGAGSGKSKLNAGEETPLVQALISGKTAGIRADDPEKAIAVARKLLKIYCAGSCSRIYFEQAGKIDAETEIDIPGQDLRYIELMEQFLVAHDPDYKDGFVNRLMTGIFNDLGKEEIRKPIEVLARQLLKSEDKPFSRFHVEDAFRLAGFKPPRQQEARRFSFQVEEDHLPKAPEPVYSVNEARLDNALKDFLLMIKSDWSQEEVDVSIQYLKSLFKKFGG